MTITGPTKNGDTYIWTAETVIPAGETWNFDIEREGIGVLLVQQKADGSSTWKRGVTIVGGEGDINVNFNLTNDATNVDVAVRVVSYSKMTSATAE